MMGFPAAGKSSVAREFEKKGYTVLNRDRVGGTVAELLPRFQQLLKAGKDVLLDNTFPTAESRKPFIEMHRKWTDAGLAPMSCLWMGTSIEDAQVNACHRLVQHFGHLPTPEEIKASKSPNIYPPAVLFKYRKEFEAPTTEEGFDKVEKKPFIRHRPKNTAVAILLDFDGTLRETISGRKFPNDPKDVRILPGCKKKLKQLQKDGALLLGVSNQSGIAKGDPTEVQARACFDATLKQLGIKMEYLFCPHRVPPISCWCRKPMPGLSVHFVEKYKLDPSQCLVVGDMTTDQTFAKRSGMEFAWAKDFFK